MARRRLKRKRRRNVRKWIKGAIKRPGALRKKFARWYGLKSNQKIPASMYARGYRRAKRRGDTRTMRQINLAKTLSGLRRRKKKKRVIRVGKFPSRRRRRKVANPRRLTVPEKHQLRIARRTLKMTPQMVKVMGGPTIKEAREIIRRLTGKKIVKNPKRSYKVEYKGFLRKVVRYFNTRRRAEQWARQVGVFKKAKIRKVS